MNILDLNYDIMSKIENIIKRKKHLDEIHNYEFPTFHGYRFTDDDPYEYYVYNGRKYETRCRKGGGVRMYRRGCGRMLYSSDSDDESSDDEY
eukprot:SAG11_NODE_3573_length_2359_cov_145.957522_4_plen_92_part_00